VTRREVSTLSDSHEYKQDVSRSQPLEIRTLRLLHGFSCQSYMHVAVWSEMADVNAIGFAVVAANGSLGCPTEERELTCPP
jgi:hypothetical protein